MRQSSSSSRIWSTIHVQASHSRSIFTGHVSIGYWPSSSSPLHPGHLVSNVIPLIVKFHLNRWLLWANLRSVPSTQAAGSLFYDHLSALEPACVKQHQLGQLKRFNLNLRCFNHLSLSNFMMLLLRRSQNHSSIGSLQNNELATDACKNTSTELKTTASGHGLIIAFIISVFGWAFEQEYYYCVVENISEFLFRYNSLSVSRKMCSVEEHKKNSETNKFN